MRINIYQTVDANVNNNAEALLAALILYHL